MIIKNNQVLLPIGMISLLLAIVLNRYAGEGNIIDFLEGLFIGLSIVMNIAYLLIYKRGK